MKKKILVAVSLLLFAGLVYLAFNWKPLFLSWAGYVAPKAESTAAIVDYAETHRINAPYLAIAAGKREYNYLSKNFGVPGIIIFNKRQLPIKSSAGTSCTGVAHDFLNKLGSVDSFQVDSSNLSIRSLTDILSRVKFLKQDSAALVSVLSGDGDYIAVHSWAKYLPKQSQALAGVLNKVDFNKKKIALVSLNLDYSDLWMSQDSLDKDFQEMEIQFK